MKWKQNGSTIAGENTFGNKLNQLVSPEGIYLDDDDNQTLYIADFGNRRIVKWKIGAKNGEILAGGNGMDQLNRPSDLTIDKKTDSVIICDSGNKRVIRQSLQDPIHREIIIRDISCFGLAMDNNKDLYVTNSDENEVRRWSLGDMNEVLVAGGNGRGEDLNQLNDPTHIFVDEDHSVYVSERDNHRVTKWLKGAQEGIIVAGGRGLGDDVTQLTLPFGIFVDRFGNVYVADPQNHRVMRWLKDAAEGSVVVQRYLGVDQWNELDSPKDLSFDRKGNIYLSDNGRHQVRKFDVDVD
jgi:sugar lactone lactonase YvrE